MTTVRPAPPFDAELQPVLAELLKAFSPALRPEDIPMLRSTKFNPDAAELVEGRPLAFDVHAVAGPAGPQIVTVFRRSDHATAGPGFFFTHVGGLILGDAFNGLVPIIDYVEKFDAVAVTVDWRGLP